MARLQKALSAEGYAGAVVTSSANLQYLTGFREGVWERFAGLFLSAGGVATLVVPELSRRRAEHDEKMVDVVSYRDEQGPGTCVVRSLRGFGRKGVLGVEWSFMFRDWELIQSVGEYSFRNVSSMLDGMRAVKGDEEVALIKRACVATDRGLEDLQGLMREGMTEVAIAREIKDRIMEHGGESIPFCLVQSGPNAAVPHNEPGRRKVVRGDIVVVDVGCTVDGYNSDITRVYVLGRLSVEQERVLEAVLDAQRQAISVVKQGEEARVVDKAARTVIKKAGYDRNFIHRTGHGLGLEVHEEPYIHGSNAELLREGMVFTVEPGVYLEGKFGVRIEDDARVTSGGCEVLSGSSKVFS